MKKTIIPLLAVLLVAACAVAYLNHKRNTYNINTQETTSQDFSENVYHRSNTYISGSKIIGSNGRYIYYLDMQSGVGNPLCSVPNCLHNNTQECMAMFSDEYCQEFVYVYNQKLIEGGTSGVNTKLTFFSADLDGSNHEKIASVNLRNDMEYREGDEAALENGKTKSVLTFETMPLSNYIVKDDKVYIGVTLEDTENIEETKSGIMSYGPSIVMVYCLDLATNKLEKVYEFEDNLYSQNMEFRYFQGDKLYFDFSGMKAQYEEVFDMETDAFKSSETRALVSTRVGCLDLDTRTVTWLDAYAYKDYVGTRNQERYFLEREKDGFSASGEIRVEDFDGTVKDTISIPDIKGIEFIYDSCVLAVEDGFLVEIYNADSDSEYFGSIGLYDTSGNRREYIEKSKYAVVGEQDKYYLLAYSVGGVYPKCYISKDDFKSINRKSLALVGVEE